MSTPNSDPGDLLKGYESDTRSPELNAESSNELDSITPKSIRDILNDHGNILTQLQTQNNELKEIVTDIRGQHIQILNHITDLSNLISKDKSPKANPQSETDTVVSGQSEQFPKPQEAVAGNLGDVYSTTISGNTASEGTSEPEHNCTDDLADNTSTTTSVNVHSEDNNKSEIKLEPGSSVAPYSVDVVDKNDSTGEDVVTVNPISIEDRGSVISELLVVDEETQNTASSLKPIPEKLCFLCNKVATLPPCENCTSNKVLPKEEIPPYCGQAHKDLHEACGHDKNCCGIKASKLGWKEVRGIEGINKGLPYYVATRDLQPGHRIFTKKPLFTSAKPIEPNALYSFKFQISKLGSYIAEKKLTCQSCIVCFELIVYGELIEDPLHGVRMHKCLDCGWPVHSPHPDARKLCKNSCQKKHEKECKTLVQYGLLWDSAEPYSYLYLEALRAVLDPIVRQKLLALPFHRRTVPHFGNTFKFVRKVCHQSDVSDEDLKRIINVIHSNKLLSSLAYFSIRKKHNQTIYEGGHTGRILPHDCNPNCSILVNPITGETTFKTRRTVKQDEMLTINYVVDAFPQPIDQRARYLRNRQIDHCSCAKCKDGQDFTSAMKEKRQTSREGIWNHKKSCRSKYLMPYSTRLQESKQAGTSKSTQAQLHANKRDQGNSDKNNIYVWQCDFCKTDGPRMEQSISHGLIDRIKKELRLLFNGRKQENAYRELKEIIKAHSDVDLHPDHSVMILAQVTLGYTAVEQMRIKGDRREVLEYHKYFDDVDKAIQMLRRADNGRSEAYGTLLYCHTLLKMRHLAQKRNIKKKNRNPSEHEFKTSYESIIRDLEESWEIIKNNPYLTDTDINRDIRLFKLYSQELESYVSSKSFQESMLETFRKKQMESIETAQPDPFSGSWYLCRVKSDVMADSIEKMNADINGPGAFEEGNLVKQELLIDPHVISGAFIRALYSF